MAVRFQVPFVLYEHYRYRCFSLRIAKTRIQHDTHSQDTIRDRDVRITHVSDIVLGAERFETNTRDDVIDIALTS